MWLLQEGCDFAGGDVEGPSGGKVHVDADDDAVRPKGYLGFGYPLFIGVVEKPGQRRDDGNTNRHVADDLAYEFRHRAIAGVASLADNFIGLEGREPFSAFGFRGKAHIGFSNGAGCS